MAFNKLELSSAVKEVFSRSLNLPDISFVRIEIEEPQT